MKAGLGVSGPGVLAGGIVLVLPLLSRASARALRLMVVPDCEVAALSPSVESNADEADAEPYEVEFGVA